MPQTILLLEVAETFDMSSRSRSTIKVEDRWSIALKYLPIDHRARAENDFGGEAEIMISYIRNLEISKASLKSQAQQGTSLFTRRGRSCIEFERIFEQFQTFFYDSTSFIGGGGVKPVKLSP